MQMSLEGYLPFQLVEVSYFTDLPSSTGVTRLKCKSKMLLTVEGDKGILLHRTGRLDPTF